MKNNSSKNDGLFIFTKDIFPGKLHFLFSGNYNRQQDDSVAVHINR